MYQPLLHEPAVFQHLEVLRVLAEVASAPAGYPPQRKRRLWVLSTRQAPPLFTSTSSYPQLLLSFLLSVSLPPSRCCPDGFSFASSIAICVCGSQFEFLNNPLGIESLRGSGETYK